MSLSTGSDRPGFPEEPLGYPGRAPSVSGLIAGGEFHELRLSHGSRLGRAATMIGPTEIDGLDEPVSLDAALLVCRASPMASRFPVLAVGSNASPDQLRGKFAAASVSQVVPLTRAAVSGLRPGHSAHVSRPGYVPAAPVRDGESRAELFVLWLDAEQMAALDDSEPNYRRACLDPEAHAVRLVSGELLSRCGVYDSRWGVLALDRLRPLDLTDQSALLGDLLDRSSRLALIAGDDAKAWIQRCGTDGGVRDRVRECFMAEGWTISAGPAVSVDESLRPYGDG